MRAAAQLRATATRTSSPAASGSASASPARWRSNPQLLIADEPTCALDVSVQATVPRAVPGAAAASCSFACLFISHDLAVVDILADRIAVMHHGKLVEQGTRDEILRNPKEAYTQRLIAAVPVPDPELQHARARAPRCARRCESPSPDAPEPPSERRASQGLTSSGWTRQPALPGSLSPHFCKESVMAHRHSAPDLRNVAIVAHVDHGKTTLVDAMLRQTNSFGDARARRRARDGLERARAREGHHDPRQEHGDHVQGHPRRRMARSPST